MTDSGSSLPLLKDTDFSTIYATMPIRGTTHTQLVSDEAPFFRSLLDLDEWAATPAARLESVLPYVPRIGEFAGVTNAAARGKLLVRNLS